MATFDLTSGDDFVHIAGDGRVPIPGFTELALATDLADLARMVGGGTDYVYLGGANDTLQAGAFLDATDTVDGGAGYDEVVFNGDYSAGLILTGQRLLNVESLKFTSGHQYTITLAAGLGAMTINALSSVSSDRLVLDGTAETSSNLVVQGSGGGDDIRLGSGELNQLYGNSGNDYLSSMADGASTITGGSGHDTIAMTGTGIAYLYGDSGDDIITSAGWINTIEAGIGNDQVTFSHARVLVGGSVTGGTGNDRLTIDGTVIHEAFLELAASGFESVYFATGAQLHGHDGANRFDLSVTLAAGSAAATVHGNQGDDTIIGTTAGDTLWGESGADSLLGADGNDHLLGGTEDDRLFGGANSDTLEGNNDQDYLDGGADNDVLIGGNGDDALLGGQGLDILWGDTGDDTLDAGTDDDVLYGQGGHDTLNGGDGNDTLFGGTGNDVYIVSDSDTLTEDAGAGRDRVESAISFALGANFEDLTLTGTAANGTGNSISNVITGNASANRLTGGNGLDTLSGGDGNDTIDGGVHSDSITGGAGDDLLTGGSFADTFVFGASGAGNDTITDFQTSADLFDLGGNDFLGVSNGPGGATLTHAGGTILVAGITGWSLAQWNTRVLPEPGPAVMASIISADIYGDGGNNSLAGTADADNMFGLDGNDTIDGWDGNDYLEGNGGEDHLRGLDGNDILYGGDAFDVLEGNDNDDQLHGEGGNDALLGMYGNDTVWGDDGLDIAFTGTGNDLLYGGNDDDVLQGESGNDTIVGGAGIDTLIGSTGNDVYIDPDAADDLREDFGGGRDRVESGVTFSLYNEADVEDLKLTGSANSNGDGNGRSNQIDGNDGLNTLTGYSGNDTMDGWGGNDSLNGGQGNDILTGGLGDDTLNGGDGGDTYYVYGNDTIIEVSGGGTDVVFSADDFSLAALAYVEHLSLLGVAVNGTGNALSNQITGSAAANVLTGGNGLDTLDGGSDNDSLYGGAHQDLLIGGTGNDYLDGGSFADVFQFATSHAGNDTVAGFQSVDRFDLSGGSFTAVSDGVDGATLTHAGGTILVLGVTGLSLGAWNGYLV